MPRKIGRACRYHGCTATSDDIYCTLHTRVMSRYYNRYLRDEETTKFYQSREWREKRREYLLSHPYCTMCGGKANTVDHIKPIREGGERLRDENLQALCQSCHSKKSAKEGSRWGKRQEK